LASEGVRLAGNVFKRVPAATAATTAEQAAEGHPLSAPGAAREAALPGVETEDDANDDADDELPAASVITATEVTTPMMFRRCPFLFIISASSSVVLDSRMAGDLEGGDSERQGDEQPAQRDRSGPRSSSA